MEQEPDTPWHLHFISREARRACGQGRVLGWADRAPSLACRRPLSPPLRVWVFSGTQLCALGLGGGVIGPQLLLHLALGGGGQDRQLGAVGRDWHLQE